MDTFLQNKAFNKYLDISGYILTGIIILVLPLTHKEMFSFVLPDLILSKLILILMAIIGCYYVLNNPKEYLKDIFFRLLGIYIIFQIISLVKSYDFNSTIFFILYHLTILFAYPVIKKTVVNIKFSYVTNFYTISLIFAFIFLLCQIFIFNVFDKTIGGIWPVAGYPTRYGSTFWDVNHFAAFLVSSFFMLSGAVLNKDVIPKFKKYYLLAIVGTLVALYFTSSRSAMIGFAVSLLLGVIFTITKYLNKSKFSVVKLKELSMIAVSLFILSPIPITMFLRDSLKASFLYRSVSFYSHMFLVKVGIQTGLDNFVFGVGANAFYEYFKRSDLAKTYYYVDPAALNFKLPLHNLWLEVLAETGLVSFIVFVVFWVLILGYLYRIFTKKTDFMSLGLFCGVLSYLIAGLFYSYKNEFFWVYILLSVGYIISSIKDEIKFSIGFRNSIEFIFGKHISIQSTFYRGVLILNVIIPTLFILSNIQIPEIFEYYKETPNFILVPYYESIKLFRFVYGNYSFTGRIVSILFYLAFVTILYAVFAKKLGQKYLALIFSFINFLWAWFLPSVSVSPVNYLIFLIVFIITVLDLLTKYRKKVSINLSTFNATFVVILCLWFTSLTLYLNIRYFSNGQTYSNLVFISELANNRTLFDQSILHIDQDLNPDVLRYFCDKVNIANNKFFYEECDLVSIGKFSLTDLDPNVKEAFLVKKNKIKEELNNPDLKNLYYKFTVISTNDVVLIYHEKPKVYLQ